MLETGITYSKSDEQLKEYARRYLRECRSSEHRRMAKSGELEQHLQTRADAARGYAEDLDWQGHISPAGLALGGDTAFTERQIGIWDESRRQS